MAVVRAAEAVVDVSGCRGGARRYPQGNAVSSHGGRRGRLCADAAPRRDLLQVILRARAARILGAKERISIRGCRYPVYISGLPGTIFRVRLVPRSPLPEAQRFQVS